VDYRCWNLTELIIRQNFASFSWITAAGPEKQAARSSPLF